MAECQLNNISSPQLQRHARLAVTRELSWTLHQWDRLHPQMRDALCRVLAHWNETLRLPWPNRMVAEILGLGGLLNIRGSQLFHLDLRHRPDREFVADWRPLLVRCRMLRSIALWLTDEIEDLRPHLQWLPYLRSVELYGRVGVVFRRLPLWDNLHSLRLESIMWLCDDHLQPLEQFQELAELHMVDCPLITIDGLRTIDRCRGLHSLTLYQMNGVACMRIPESPWKGLRGLLGRLTSLSLGVILPPACAFWQVNGFTDLRNLELAFSGAAFPPMSQIALPEQLQELNLFCWDQPPEEGHPLLQDQRLRGVRIIPEDDWSARRWLAYLLRFGRPLRQDFGLSLFHTRADRVVFTYQPPPLCASPHSIALCVDPTHLFKLVSRTPYDPLDRGFICKVGDQFMAWRSSMADEVPLWSN